MSNTSNKSNSKNQPKEQDVEKDPLPISNEEEIEIDTNFQSK